ncbi:hypothetical protein DBR06_SOUSAS22610043, partial [Sousa chinensis]
CLLLYPVVVTSCGAQKKTLVPFSSSLGIQPPTAGSWFCQTLLPKSLAGLTHFVL